MNKAYINIVYGKNRTRIRINSFLYRSPRNGIRSPSFYLGESNLEKIKKKLRYWISKSNEKEIIIKSNPKEELKTKSEYDFKKNLSYKKVGKDKLTEIIKSLEEKRKDITFKLEI